jgi:hypothetical protein
MPPRIGSRTSDRAASDSPGVMLGFVRRGTGYQLSPAVNGASCMARRGLAEAGSSLECAVPLHDVKQNFWA